MIKASELRIGNQIKLGREIKQVYQIIFDLRYGYSINHKDYKEDWFEPIPLTPEILQKSGFMKDDDNSIASTYYHYSEGIGTAFINFIKDGKDGMFFRMHDNLKSLPVVVFHLHQLQNLYFALTGEELIINL